MKALKNIIAAVFMLIGTNSISAQLSESIGYDSLSGDRDFILNQEIQGFSDNNSVEKVENPFNINYFAGTGYSYSRLFGSKQNINVGVNASYILSQRFRVNVGSIVGFSRYAHIPSSFTVEPGVPATAFNSPYVSFYVRGDYFVTPRLIVSGTVFKEFSPNRNQNINPLFLNHNLEGMSLQLNYKLLDNLHFGAQFNYIKNDYPYNPFGRNRSVMDNFYW